MPGSFVHEAYGQVPPATNWHSPWVAQPVGPVLVYPAWISEKPSGEDGVSQVAYENCRPVKVTSWTGAWAVPRPSTSFSSTGASTSALRGSSPGRGR